MRSTLSPKLMIATAALAIVAGVTEASAFSCSASNSALVTKSTGGSCGAALSLNQEFTIQYRITNASIIDDPMAPNDQDPAEATITSGSELDATLAQETADVLGTELPSVLEFVPVCDAGSSMNAGLECDPMAPNCGTGDCGCQSSQPGVTCVASGANHVTINFGSDLVFAGDEEHTIATILVRLTDTVSPPAICGEFFTRIDSTGDVMETSDVDCTGSSTAGAQGSSGLHAPECASDADCGDPECNVCADLGTDNHCETANIGSSCGTDSDPDDCLLPACTVEGQDLPGVCSQGETNEAEGSSCEGDGIDCTEDVCDDGGSCLHTEDDTFCDDADSCTEEFCSPSLDCVYEFICEGSAICRSPGYWATHSGYEKSPKSTNVGQLVIDAAGPLEVCGQTIDSTSNASSPYLDGLGLDSDLEGLCMRAKGVPQRQLYRQLVAAALNCGITGDDCETVTDPFIGVSYDDCNALCAGDPVVDPPTVGECIAQLDCFNNGGQVIMGDCAFGTCSENGEFCDGDFGDCPDFEGDPQVCEVFPGNCHDAVLCNEAIDVCPKSGPASSSAACREARGNSCTIDDCN